MRISRSVCISSLAFVTAIGAHAGEKELDLNGPYLGQEPPGSKARLFAPQLFGEDEWAGCSGFLDGGRVFIFSSMKDGTNWRFKPTFVMKLEESGWTAPELAPFNDHLPYNFTVGPGGTTLYFTSLKSPDTATSMLLERANIWAVTLSGDSWSEPVMLGPSLNTEEHSENYPTVALDGTIYYMGHREDTLGGTDVYRSKDLGNRYAEAENIGVPVNGIESDQDPFIAPDGSYLIVCLTGREDGFGKYDLYVSAPDGKGGWSEPVNLGEVVNTPGSEFRPFVTADGKYLFYTSPDPASGNRGRIHWVSTDVIREKLRLE
jgi:hypothetical protein